MNQYGKPDEADCEHCPLRNRPFVPHEVPATAPRFVILGESPGGHEILESRPFVGRSGRLLNQACRAAGGARNEALVMNTVACQPPRGMNQRDWTAAITACAGHRTKLLKGSGATPILALGKRALQALSGKSSIINWYGYPLTVQVAGSERLMFPAVHPAFVLRMPHWLGEFQESLRRFGAILRGEWRPWESPPMQLEGPVGPHLTAMRGAVCIDSETAGTSPQFDDCIALGASDGKVTVSQQWSRETEEDHAQWQQLLSARAPSAPLVFHNAQHDLLVLERRCGLVPRVDYHRSGVVVDTLLMHAALYPGLPHRLSVAAACFFVPRWKSAFHDESEAKGTTKFTGAKMAQLLPYNGLDCYHDINLYHALKAKLAANPRAQEVFDRLCGQADLALHMRRAGLAVDELARARLRKRFLVRRDAALIRYGRLVLSGKLPDVDFGEKASTDAVRTLFFQTLNCAVLEQTPSGAPALNAWVLQRYASGHGALTKAARVAARLVLRFRRSVHMVGMLASLPVTLDKRVHPPWNPWGAITERWSCGKPNLMNAPKRGINNIRVLFVADENCLLVAADMDKVELRIIAILAGDAPLLKAFEAGTDVHQANAIDLFGPSANAAQRDLAKRLVYGFNYGAAAETVWKKLVVEFPKLQLAVVELLKRRWFEKHPAIRIWQAQVLETAVRTKQVAAPVGPRIEEFPMGQVDPNKVYNFPVQSTVAKVVADAQLALYDAGWDVRINCHDEVVLNVPKARVLEAIAALKEHLEKPVTLLGKPHILPVEVKVGISWGALQTVEKHHASLIPKAT